MCWDSVSLSVYPPTSPDRRVRVPLHFSYLIPHISYPRSHNFLLSYLVSYIWGGSLRGGTCFKLVMPYYTYCTILTILTYLLMGFIPYARLHTQMPIWSYLELSGALWNYLELSGAIWTYLELSEAICNHLEVSGAIWSYLELSGAIWNYLELSGPFSAAGAIRSCLQLPRAIWSYLKLPEAIGTYPRLSGQTKHKTTIPNPKHKTTNS